MWATENNWDNYMLHYWYNDRPIVSDHIGHVLNKLNWAWIESNHFLCPSSIVTIALIDMQTTVQLNDQLFLAFSGVLRQKHVGRILRSYNKKKRQRLMICVSGARSSMLCCISLIHNYNLVQRPSVSPLDCGVVRCVLLWFVCQPVLGHSLLQLVESLNWFISHEHKHIKTILITNRQPSACVCSLDTVIGLYKQTLELY